MKPNRWPARLDLWQSLSGLFLAVFIAFHLSFDASILIGPEAFAWVGHALEGGLFLERPQPWLTSLAGLAVLLLIAFHALLALRKFPANMQQHRAMHAHVHEFRHGDTRLWLVQLWTGFAMFFLAPVHLYMVIAMPKDIGPVLSSQRVVWDLFWPLYLLLLIAVVLHAAIGMYRLALKWGWPAWAGSDHGRRRLRRLTWAVILVFTLVGLLALGRFIEIGIAHPRTADAVELHAVSDPVDR